MNAVWAPEVEAEPDGSPCEQKELPFFKIYPSLNSTSFMAFYNVCLAAEVIRTLQKQAAWLSAIIM